jgi:phosphoribosylanthranilate isomerase
MLKIKVCGLRDIENVSELVKAVPDFMGFIFYPGSARYVGKNPEEILFSQIPSDIIKTGVFVNETTDNVKEKIDRFSLDAVQFHGSESPDYCRYFRKNGLIITKSFPVDSGFDFRQLTPYFESCDYFLFDSKTTGFGGSGIKFDRKILEGYNLEKPFFLSGGIGYEDICEIKNLRHKELSGIDINSRFEVLPGIKNAGLIKSFIDEIRNE